MNVKWVYNFIFQRIDVTRFLDNYHTQKQCNYYLTQYKINTIIIIHNSVGNPSLI